MLERSIVDRMVGAPERLVFEGAPILVEPLAQSVEARRPDVTEGDWLDTLAACPPLTIVEKARVKELRSKATHAARRQIRRSARGIHRQTGRGTRETQRRVAAGGQGNDPQAMRRRAAAAIVLPFDDPELAGKTVADVLADPGSFEGETLADPLEGIEYGRCKAGSCAAPTERRGSTASRMAGPSMS